MNLNMKVFMVIVCLFMSVTQVLVSQKICSFNFNTASSNVVEGKYCLKATIGGVFTGYTLNNNCVLYNGAVCTMTNTFIMTSIKYDKKARVCLEVYPNPAFDEINFDLNEFINQEIYDIEIIDIRGQLIRIIQMDSLIRNHQKITFDISSLSAGLYFVNIVNKNTHDKISSCKFFKIR